MHKKISNLKHKKEIHHIFYWSPRIIGILFAIFLYSFVIEVFSKPFNFSNFLYSIIPGTFILILIFLFWKHEVVGGWLFIILSFVYLFFLIGRETLFVSSILLSVPIFFIGMLFLIDEYLIKEHREYHKKRSKRLS